MKDIEESDGIVPGGRQTLATSESCAQLQLPASEVENKAEHDDEPIEEEDELEPEVSDSKILEMLNTLPYHVFVLSAYGKPIFASAGHEDRMCPLFALVQAFVHKVESWKDNLCSIDAPNLHVRFSHRHPLILCIASRSPFQLTNQLDVIYHQVLSILSKTQLKKVYEIRGENYDIRKMLRGDGDKSLSRCISAWRADPAIFMSGVRVLPMACSDREFIASTIASTVNATKLTDGVIFGIVIAHRQLVAYVRMKRYLLAPCDLHILINMVHNNSAFRHVEGWAPICLPRFNNQGFLHAHISYLWDDSDAALLLISTSRDMFYPLSMIRNEIIGKLNGSKHCTSIRESIHRPIAFELKQIGCPDLWHFIYNNTSSSQVCSSSFEKPFVSRIERAQLIEQYNGLHHYIQRRDSYKPGVKTLFIVKPSCTVYVVINPSYELYCTFSPLVQRSTTVACTEKLIKALKKEEGRFFYVVTSNFVN
ncbi:hypothetical protein L596_004579 [Steinernema carpocapsae]|uniref:Vacuolar fusion protein MON1 homolog n=1 Tax=Steinernema carpocapsae TaxID=34508 RepID=A0A4U8UXU8_STECR|nr:hypothetical protein L596_004579 [Steinernema carpocapsae]